MQEVGLKTINGIQKYRYLQNVNVQGNNLTNLKSLSDLKHLLRLNASNN